MTIKIEDTGSDGPSRCYILDEQNQFNSTKLGHEYTWGYVSVCINLSCLTGANCADSFTI